MNWLFRSEFSLIYKWLSFLIIVIFVESIIPRKLWGIKRFIGFSDLKSISVSYLLLLHIYTQRI
jgi:hypothetical protein